jgi:hypothetical protein
MVSKEYAMERIGLTEAEYDKFKKWYEKNRKKVDYGDFCGGCGGGDVEFRILPTSFGELIYVKCFGKKKTIRDFD